MSRDSRDVGDNDTEGQSLLTGQDTTGYGATVTAPNNAASTERDDKIAEDQHDARLTNRLIKAGNWWDYAKEFHVSSCYQGVSTLLTTYRFSSHTFGLPIARGFNAKLCFLDSVRLQQIS